MKPTQLESLNNEISNRIQILESRINKAIKVSKTTPYPQLNSNLIQKLMISKLELIYML